MFVLRPIYIYINKAFESMIVRDKPLWINSNKEGERRILSYSKSVYNEECISIYYCPLKCVLLFIVKYVLVIKDKLNEKAEFSHKRFSLFF